MPAPITILPGQTWTPTRPGSRAKPRTVVCVIPVRPLLGIDRPVVGYAFDLSKPKFLLGNDSWVAADTFRSWIREHQAVRSASSATHPEAA